MELKAASGIMLVLILTNMLALSFRVQMVKAESIENIVHEIAWGSQRFYIATVSNSAVTPIPMTFDQQHAMVTFNVTGPVDTTGFCNIIIPKNFMRGEPWLLFVDGINTTHISSENQTHSSLYFTYQHSTHEVYLIGTWGIGPLLLPVHNINTGSNYSTIQEAINAPETLDGHTIYVEAGTYNEHIVVKKSVSLIGENKCNTIIDGGGTGNVIYVNANNVKISGFTIQNGGLIWREAGIFIESSVGTTIGDNVVSNNGWAGIFLNHSSYNNITANNIIANNSPGIELYESSNNNIVSGNNVTYNHYGIWVFRASYNNLHGNDILKNDLGIRLCYCAPNNKIYNNNFIENLDQVYSHESTNTWDDDYPSGGNYWSDYTGVDMYRGLYQNETGSDGIGDTPYVIDKDNIDRYPLKHPYGYVPGPDVNDDGIVDMYDITIWAQAFPSQPGWSNWNPLVDLHPDGIIDIFDAVIISVNYGKKYP